MTTTNQRRRKIRKPQKNFVASPGLQKCPQRRGRITRLLILAPRKPNSARRRAAKIRMTTGRFLIAKIPGTGYLPIKFAVVLVKGKGFNDTPNAKYSMIRGALECMPMFDRQSRRSKFGASRS